MSIQNNPAIRTATFAASAAKAREACVHKETRFDLAKFENLRGPYTSPDELPYRAGVFSGVARARAKVRRLVSGHRRLTATPMAALSFSQRRIGG